VYSGELRAFYRFFFLFVFWAGYYYFDTYTGGERVVSARAEQLEFDRKWKRCSQAEFVFVIPVSEV
jgi:hypothetical protein